LYIPAVIKSVLHSFNFKACKNMAGCS
jgi:hypothetical protein